MRTIVISFGLVLGTAAHCQQNEVGLFSGPGMSRLHGNTILKETDLTPSYQVGGCYTHWFKNGLGIQAQLSYNTMGGAQDLIFTNEFGEEISRGKAAYGFGHLGAALGATFRTPGRLHALASIGVMPTTIVVAEFEAPTDRGPLDRSVLDLTAKARNPVLFGYGCFGAAFNLKAPITLGLLFRYDHGITTYSRKDFFENEDLYATSWTAALTVAYRWSRANITLPAE